MRIGVYILGILAALILSSVSIFAQTQKFDVMTFTPPKGWEMEKDEDRYVFTKSNEKKGNFCYMFLNRSLIGKGSAKADFTHAWNSVIKERFSVDLPKEIDITKNGEFTISQSGATIDFQGGESFLALTTISGKKQFVPFVVITNETEYLDEAFEFLSTVDISFGGQGDDSIKPRKPSSR